MKIVTQRFLLRDFNAEDVDAFAKCQSGSRFLEFYADEAKATPEWMVAKGWQQLEWEICADEWRSSRLADRWTFLGVHAWSKAPSTPETRQSRASSSINIGE